MNRTTYAMPAPVLEGLRAAEAAHRGLLAILRDIEAMEAVA